MAVTSSWLDPSEVAALRTALNDYTVEGLYGAVDDDGRRALARGDLDGVERALPEDGVGWLARLFLLGQCLGRSVADSALAPFSVDTGIAAGLLRHGTDDTVVAAVELRPYGEAESSGGHGWWVLADFDADVRPGPLADDHVLGVGAAATTLAQSVVRTRVKRALDVGIGCGVQALHLARHADRVVGTDVNPRALGLAATVAALNGERWDLRHGSLFAPVAGETFDLIVSNPPFVMSPWMLTYRDGGGALDELCRQLVTGAPDHLTPGGTAQVLANWAYDGSHDWTDRVGGWLVGRRCDAWVWQREVVDPGAYVSLWLRDGGEQPGTASWRERYDVWCTWLEAAGVEAIGMGMVTLRRTDRRDPVVMCEDVPQALGSSVGDAIDGWLRRARWLAETSDAELARAVLRAPDDVELTTVARASGSGWRTVVRELRQTSGLRWRVEVDEGVAALSAGARGVVDTGTLLTLLAASGDGSLDDALPVVRDLVARGFLIPDLEDRG